MLVDGQDTTTPLTVLLRRARPSRSGSSSFADPLADPVLGYARPFGDGAVLFRQGRRLHPDHRRRRAPMHRFPVLFGAQARQGQRPSARRDHDAHADGLELSDARPAFQILRPGHASRWSRWCRTPAAGTTPSRLPARPNITTTSAIPATSTARRISTARWPTRASRRAPAGWRSTSSSTPAIDAARRHRLRRAVVAAGRLCAAAGADRHRLRVLGLSRRHHAGQWLEPRPTFTFAPIRAEAKFSRADRQTNDPRRRAEHDPRDRLPCELRQAHPQLRRVQGLLAGQFLRQGRADRGILGLPREGRGASTCRRCASSRSPARIPRRCCNTR